MVKKLDIYEYSDYRHLIQDLIRSYPARGRGIQAKMAKALGCQPPFITHVLAERSHLSQEQALGAAKFFGLDKEGTKFLICLLNYNRAGTSELRSYWQSHIVDQKLQQRQLSKQLKIKERLSIDDQMTYYSSWLFGAVHIALTVPALRTTRSVANYLNVSRESVEHVLHFLVQSGLVKSNGRDYEPTQTLLHLPKGSPALVSHHTNWRHRAIDSFLSERESDLHYSGVFSCARSDIPRLQKMLLALLSDFSDRVKPSPEEEVVAINLDLFRLGTHES
jgi:uncharacterized protein (TIGR02147 family)